VKLSELAERLECRLEGDGAVEITRVSGIQDAGPGDITFLANSKYERLLGSTRASAITPRRSATAAPT
jgi:UDP-3-O-[3-hydroxymyristoyl] glucosamine N-acyltransferase